ncbi:MULTISPECIES: hypothetical protein [unclassified Mesorhizobium]|uniref:hypothetical protein n=1 Tax=unclassified Mesorhizobium TaxID=325217 RepID=UPI001FE0F854|nr:MULTISPECIES: hypothetical protein [unclassified Mesorhizobium]
MPLQVYGFDGTDVNLLRDLNAKSGYESIAINTGPGVASLAVNVAVAKLRGVDVPMKMVAPIPEITLSQLKADHSGVAESDIVWVKYTYDWTLKNVIGAK